MHFDAELTVVFVVCVTLALGAATRLFSARTRVPYTIAMLLLGLLTGLVLKQLEGVGGGGREVLAALASGANITPHLIIFVFLPTLVFESAYALDVYAFRKNLGAVIVLAVPALLVATGTTALLMLGLTRGSWDWSVSAALVFGALISATDPVAVVAILRELGAPKRLGVLIEGESLFNDGTAIVVFGVLLGLLVAGGGVDLGSTAVSFAWVVSGGIAVGFLLAYGVAAWIARTFNDSTVEITLTIVLAYAAMIVGEGMLHVSGVMAVVVAGLWMGGPGRTRISPEVRHFLHEFWEMLAYIANTLIFYMVGLVIAAQVDQASWTDALLVLGAYGGIMVIRFAVTFAFLPAIGLVGERVSRAEATVMAWGGLRGAVSLALALIVAQNPEIDELLRQQILLVTAGVVLLTISVNGATAGLVLRWVGLDKPPLAERVAQLAASASVLGGVREKIRSVSLSRALRTVSWDAVMRDLELRRREIERELAQVRQALTSAGQCERASGYWCQALSVEREAYWSAFADGTLGRGAATFLDREIEAQLDRIGRGQMSPPAERVAGLGRVGGWVARLRRSLGVGFGPTEFDRLCTIYDLSRAESMAAVKVLDSLDHLEKIDPTIRGDIESTYRHYHRAGKERLEDMRSNLPELTCAIETRLARRIQLNFERDGFQDSAHHGAIDQATARAALDEVKREMKRLRQRPRELSLPETADLVRSTPLFSSLDASALQDLAEMTIEQVLAPGEVLFNAGDRADSMFVVARGAIHVIDDVERESTVVEVLGGGDIIGEMALLTDSPRTATIRAATTVTVGKINRDAFGRLMESQPELREQVWDGFARRQFDNLLRNDGRFTHLNHNARSRWYSSGTQRAVAAGEAIDVAEAHYVFVVLGEIDVAGKVCAAPTLHGTWRGDECTAVTDGRIVLVGEEAGSARS